MCIASGACFVFHPLQPRCSLLKLALKIYLQAYSTTDIQPSVLHWYSIQP